MKKVAALSPLGTARERWAKDDPRVGDAARFPHDVVARLASRDLGPELVYLAWELSRAEAGAGQRALFFIALAALVYEAQGSTRVPVEGPDSSAFHALLEELGAIAKERDAIRARLAEVRTAPTSGGAAGRLIGRRDERVPLVVEGGYLALQRLVEAEERFVATIAPRLVPQKPEAEALALAWADLVERPPRVAGKAIVLSPEQEQAVRAAAVWPLTLVTGGPGTGKTSVIVTLLRLLVRLDVPVETIALAAPTGKAAQRMEQSIRRGLEAVVERSPLDEQLLASVPTPQTIHRLLGYSPSSDRFRHHENNRLAQRVVIVDEGSMIDLRVADALVRSLRDDARLVMLGDADQLPSVEAGAVFRDLVRASGRVVRLARSYRMDASDEAGRALALAARLVNQGDADALEREAVVTPRGTAAEVTFEAVEWLDVRQREAFFERWYSARIRSMPDFDRVTRKVYRHGAEGFTEEDTQDILRLLRHHERSRILCVTRVGGAPTSVEAVNARLHAMAAPKEASIDAVPSFTPGEPVLVTRNDYGRELFNGEQGVVLRVASEGAREHHLAVVFARADGTVAAFPLDALLASIELAYATTVHKAQGSEFEAVAVVLPDEDLPLLTRELVYTAMTRSRRSVVVVGARERLSTAVRRTAERFGGVAERLGQIPT